jgi:hypothetical protein
MSLILTPVAPVVWPYNRRVTVQRNVEGMYAFLLSLNGWNLGTDLRVIAKEILDSGDASSAGARIAASSETVLWIDVEPD